MIPLWDNSLRNHLEALVFFLVITFCPVGVVGFCRCTPAEDEFVVVGGGVCVSRVMVVEDQGFARVV